jgi:hypothetical protein
VGWCPITHAAAIMDLSAVGLGRRGARSGTAAGMTITNDGCAARGFAMIVEARGRNRAAQSHRGGRAMLQPINVMGMEHARLARIVAPEAARDSSSDDRALAARVAVGFARSGSDTRKAGNVFRLAASCGLGGTHAQFITPSFPIFRRSIPNPDDCVVEHFRTTRAQ